MKLLERKIAPRKELPFIPDDSTYLYISNRLLVDRSLEETFPDVQAKFREKDSRLIYFPALAQVLTPEKIGYFVPNFSGRIPTWRSLQRRFAKALRLRGAGPFLVHFEDGEACVVDLDRKAAGWSAVEEYIDSQVVITLDAGEDFVASEACYEKCSEVIPDGPRFRVSYEEDSGPRFRVVFGDGVAPKPTIAPQKSAEEKEIEANDQASDEVIKTTLAELEALGVSPDIIAKLIRSKKQPSRLHITKFGRVSLDDYAMEIQFPDKLSLALYLLILNHEEGINLKDLADYENELLDYYSSVSGRGDKDGMAATIKRLVVPYNDNVNTLISRIKRRFIESFDEDLAKQYYITGKKGENKKIMLDRSLVIWDAIRPPYNRQ